MCLPAQSATAQEARPSSAPLAGSAVGPPAIASAPGGVGGASIDPGAARVRQYEALCAASARMLERGLLGGEDVVDRRALYADAERYARAAVELVPEGADGYFLVAAALGARSEMESIRRRVRMAGEVHAAALSALERDSSHAGAHHVLGRLNFEAMRAPALSRMIARHLLGSSVMRSASWEQAEVHLRRAAALEPAALVHRLWLARLHMERDEREAARRELQTILSLKAVTELDRQWRREAGEELARL